jgi:hypothetical protein
MDALVDALGGLMERLSHPVGQAVRRLSAIIRQVIVARIKCGQAFSGSRSS